MPKTIVILGNGFDLDLGLHTSYGDFVKSPQWTGLMEGNGRSLDDNWLLGYLQRKVGVNQWVDLESALLEYAVIKTNGRDFRHAKEDALDFDALCNSLKEYLLDQQSDFTPRNKSVAFFFLELMSQISGKARLYTFNYTQLNMLAAKCGMSTKLDAVHIHGSLSDDDDIILGIETEFEIDDRYAFLFKTQNRRYRHTNVIKDLRENDEYVFFGHSLNGMDYAYFRNTFNSLSISGLSAPRLTIITKDKASEERLKNFLRKQRVSLQGLFSNAVPEIILTDLVYQRDQTEIKKVESLFERAKLF